MPISIMSGSSGGLSRQLAELHRTEARPTAGRTGGSRTPRHVQWASRDDGRVSVGSAASPRPSMHALDEMGLDVCVIVQDVNALIQLNKILARGF